MRRGCAAGFMALYAAVAACSGGDNGRPVTVHDSAGIVLVKNDLARLNSTCAVGSTPTVSIGEAEGRDEYELYRVFGARRLSDGRIVLVNQGSQQIRFYDAQGKFISQAGRAGEGPGEFRDAFYLWALRGDTIWVGDYRPWQFHVFSPTGQFVRTVKPVPMYQNPPETLIVLDNGRSILGEESMPMGDTHTFPQRTVALVVHGPDGAVADRIGTFANARYGQIGDDPNGMFIYPLFESFLQVAGGGRRVLIGHGSQPELAVYDAEKAIRLERIVRWTTPDRAISSADVNAERTRLSEQYKDMPADQRKRFVEPLASTDRPVADEFPAFTNVMLGRDGRIWIKPFQRPGNGTPQNWTAFDAQGRFACTAVLPPVDEVLEFGADYLLVKANDDAGVEHVVLYSLGAPVRTN